jgi:hypothetical protein
MVKKRGLTNWSTLFTLIPSPIPLSVLVQVKLVTHSVDHGGRHIRMVKGTLHLPKIALALLQLIHSIHLAEAVHSDILGQSEGLCGPLNVPPHGLPRPMLLRTPSARENPFFPGLLPQLPQQVISKVYPTPLSCLLLGDPELPCQLISTQRNHITDPQPGSHAHPAD